MKEDETCNTYQGREKSTQAFSQKTTKEEVTFVT
jgi:hypothetical protein